MVDTGRPPRLRARLRGPADGRIVQECRDAEDIDGSGPVAGRAEGVVGEMLADERLAHRLPSLLPAAPRW
ncbi:hypothetical protein ACIODX_36680 [Streptomyces sp. NPDC088190]|uniref:hypothetical protein n=1 Tax=unclassified Streptomyces TaxID=2593676 RepID=UPI003818007F